MTIERMQELKKDAELWEALEALADKAMEDVWVLVTAAKKEHNHVFQDVGGRLYDDLHDAYCRAGQEKETSQMQFEVLESELPCKDPNDEHRLSRQQMGL